MNKHRRQTQEASPARKNIFMARASLYKRQASTNETSTKTNRTKTTTKAKRKPKRTTPEVATSTAMNTTQRKEITSPGTDEHKGVGRKISRGATKKKDRKIALFSLYLLNMYHV